MSKKNLRILAFAVGFVISIFVYDAARISMAISRGKAPVIHVAGVDQKPLAGLSESLRVFATRLDHETSGSARKTGLSWPLLVMFPGMAAFCFFFYALTGYSLIAREVSIISGEVVWNASLFDPIGTPVKKIADMITVFASTIRYEEISGNKFEKTARTGLTLYGDPYRKLPHIIALPFRIEHLPLNCDMVVECAVEKAFPARSSGVDYGPVMGERYKDTIVLTANSRRIGGLTLNVGFLNPP